MSVFSDGGQQHNLSENIYNTRNKLYLISDEQLQWNFKLLLSFQLPIQITFPLLSVTVEIDERFYAKEVFLKNCEVFKSLFSFSI